MSAQSIKNTLLWLSCIFVLLPGLLVAQSERGTISGTVRDTTGAVIPAAKVGSRVKLLGGLSWTL